MRRILIGQVSLIICCMFYILWWYRGYRPGATVDRIGGLNGMLLLMTAAFVMLLLITRTVFHRVVTTELILIVLWAVLETAVINKLNAGGFLSDKLFLFMAIVIIAVFILDIVLYVAYYRMEEMRAFYAAMVPLIAAAVTSGMLVILVMNGNRS